MFAVENKALEMSPIDKNKDQERLDREAARHLRELGKRVADKYPKHSGAELLANDAADRLERKTKKKMNKAKHIATYVIFAIAILWLLIALISPYVR